MDEIQLWPAVVITLVFFSWHRGTSKSQILIDQRLLAGGLAAPPKRGILSCGGGGETSSKVAGEQSTKRQIAPISSANLFITSNACQTDLPVASWLWPILFPMHLLLFFRLQFILQLGHALGHLLMSMVFDREFGVALGQTLLLLAGPGPACAAGLATRLWPALAGVPVRCARFWPPAGPALCASWCNWPANRATRPRRVSLSRSSSSRRTASASPISYI